jgi:hypothetical protein
MARVDVDQPKSREELAYQRQDIVRDVLALGSTDEERGLPEADLVRVLVGEVAQVVEGAAEHVQRDAELGDVLAWGAVEVAQKELADGDGLEYSMLL